VNFFVHSFVFACHLPPSFLFAMEDEIQLDANILLNQIKRKSAKRIDRLTQLSASSLRCAFCFRVCSSIAAVCED